MGLLPTEDPSTLESYRHISAQVDEGFDTPIRACADAVLARLGASPLPMPYFDALVALHDIFLQPCVPDFEYPRRDLPESVHFIGALPPVPAQASTPDIAADLQTDKRVVLVTQGTIANFDLGQLIAPTLTALADRDDVMVLATTGGRPIGDVPVIAPDNAVVREFLPFDRIMANVDVLVTNGGYGTVTHALSLGIPIVVAGLTEDKPEVSARVAWSGTGIDLRTDTATPQQIRSAVDRLLSDPAYKRRAVEIAGQFAQIDGVTEICRWLESAVEARKQR
jgi:UDP:flavonoid glycosyltransferase YjiC (YdhE family)